MNDISKKKSIAIIRGGRKDYLHSMKNGANILLSLEKHQDNLSILDIVIDKDNNWIERGIPSDAHRVFSKVDYYIDLTYDFDADYHKLAERLEVFILFKNDFNRSLNKVNLKRILSQLGFSLPKYIIFRNVDNIENKLKECWHKFHIPVVIKDTNIQNKKSILTYSFSEALTFIKDILISGHEAILEEHIQGKYISLAAIPDYRNEDIYIPTPIETLKADANHRIIQGKEIKDKYIIDHSHHKFGLVHINESQKTRLKSIAKDIYTSLGFDSHILIDICIQSDNNIKVIEIHTNPHTFKGSRFDYILENSGVDMGRFILDKIQKIEENKLIY